MKFIIFSCVLFLLFLSSCTITQSENQKFEKLVHNFTEKFLEVNPEWATGLGDHRYDNRLNDYSLTGIQHEKELYQTYLDSLNTINADRLS